MIKEEVYLMNGDVKLKVEGEENKSKADGRRIEAIGRRSKADEIINESGCEEKQSCWKEK